MNAIKNEQHKLSHKAHLIVCLTPFKYKEGLSNKNKSKYERQEGIMTKDFEVISLAENLEYNYIVSSISNDK